MRLSSLLLEHPFADDQGLLFTSDALVTAGQARQRVRAIAATITVEPGQGVAVQLPDSPELVCTMAAVWEAGAVHIPLNDRLAAPEVESILTDTGAAGIIDAGGFRSLAGSHVHAEDVAFITWTSGTTGRPKAIVHTHSAYLELLDRMIGPLRGGGPRRESPPPNLIPVSLSLNAGLYNSLFGLRVGAGLVIMDRFDPAEFAALVARFAIRSTVLPPAAMVMLNDSDVESLAPLRYVRSITAPLSPLQARRFSERFDAFVLNSYGQAEMGEVIGWTAADARDHPDKLGAAGRPHPGVEARVDARGHLWVRPRRSALGLEDRRDVDGFIDTGDIARIDEDGFVWIEGRVGDVINRGGHKVFPDAVEEVLRLDPGVDEVAVVGVPDDRLGEVPVAFVVGRFDAAALHGLCRAHLAPYRIPVEFVPIEVLPRSEIGKVLRRELVARWVEDRP